MGMSIMERNALVVNNLNLVSKIISECNLPSCEKSDLIQDGCEKFLSIANRYDTSKGALSTFIWQHVKEYVFCKNVTMPISLYKISCRIGKASEYIESSLNREVDEKDLSEFTGYNQKKLRKYKNEIQKYNTIDLDQSNGDDDSSCILDFFPSNYLSPEDELIQKEISQSLKQAWEKLNEDEKKILSLRTTYDSNLDKSLSLRQVAAEMGTTHTTASNKEKAALTHLKNILESQGLCA